MPKLRSNVRTLTFCRYRVILFVNDSFHSSSRGSSVWRGARPPHRLQSCLMFPVFVAEPLETRMAHAYTCTTREAQVELHDIWQTGLILQSLQMPVQDILKDGPLKSRDLSMTAFASFLPILCFRSCTKQDRKEPNCDSCNGTWRARWHLGKISPCPNAP